MQLHGATNVIENFERIMRDDFNCSQVLLTVQNLRIINFSKTGQQNSPGVFLLPFKKKEKKMNVNVRL